jgi:hypothetical protein
VALKKREEKGSIEMNTNTSIFAGTIGLLVAGTAMAGMNGLSYDVVEQTGDGAQAGTYTVRVYAELDADSRLDAVFGNSNFGLQIQYMGGASAYQNTTYGAPTSTGINEAFFPLAPSLEWDSYMTIGRLYSADNALQDIGIDWSNWEAGGDLPASGVVDNGTFFITPADAQGEAVDGRVLVAQLTTYATHSDSVPDVYFTAGFQGSTAGDGWQQQHSIYIDAIPAPGAIALLGLAGLAGRRRRRA